MVGGGKGRRRRRKRKRRKGTKGRRGRKLLPCPLFRKALKRHFRGAEDLDGLSSAQTRWKRETRRRVEGTSDEPFNKEEKRKKKRKERRKKMMERKRKGGFDEKTENRRVSAAIHFGRSERFGMEGLWLEGLWCLCFGRSTEK